MNSQHQRFLKYIILFAVVASITVQSSAQKLKVDQISLAYFAPLAIDPGAKFGVNFSIKEWDKSKQNKKGVQKSYRHKLYVQPQLAYFSRWRFYSSFLTNIEAGWQIRNKSKRVHSGFGIGVGYLHRQEVLTLSTQFDGSTQVAESEGRNFIFPSVNYHLGMKLYRQLFIFSKLHYGYQFSSKHTSQGALILELGLHLNLKDKKKTDE